MAAYELRACEEIPPCCARPRITPRGVAAPRHRPRYACVAAPCEGRADDVLATAGIPSQALRITPAAAKELDALPRKKDREAVVERIRALADEPRPRGSVKLSGEEALYRVRQGRYRIVYTIEDDRLVVVVIRIRHRKDAYRKDLGATSVARTRPLGRSDDDEG